MPKITSSLPRCCHDFQKFRWVWLHIFMCLEPRDLFRPYCHEYSSWNNVNCAGPLTKKPLFSILKVKDIPTPHLSRYPLKHVQLQEHLLHGDCTCLQGMNVKKHYGFHLSQMLFRSTDPLLELRSVQHFSQVPADHWSPQFVILVEMLLESYSFDLLMCRTSKDPSYCFCSWNLIYLHGKTKVGISSWQVCNHHFL